jgi:isoleucyl-tRNA synthetase
MTESIYLNLVPEEHGSIHYTDWPSTRTLTAAEQALLVRTRLLRDITSIGLKIRSDKKVKVRQPLKQATVAVPAHLLSTELTNEEIGLLQEELNVLRINMVNDPGAIAEAIAQVDARKVGPRLGGRVQEIIRMGKAGEFQVQDDGSVLIGDERLGPDEVAILYRGREGQDVAAHRGTVVALDTIITEELKLQGAARDVIRGIQQLRKDAGLDFTDRITLHIDGPADVLHAHQETILAATNASIGTVDTADQDIETDVGVFRIRFSKQT